eukprot:Blabericola_migrator_1__3253@NODE_1959_length_3495_cov_74_272462_g1248_i0_p2_GENE_NODE_1959_length_3495_cov_74_272462_g1248_i0NODE_1959_length_3495_cov_74_272462_g1248_i0_p2_ORF_typecomplete_len269_score73_53ZapB/PF06005_12/1_1e04ZapB/PF06005_12/0_023Cep57_CLD_2/PF14197_6/0_2UPF0242/PF06785_11/1_6e03UPF0242/PF06785_11/0_079Cnn_1N/PF07989_11/0_23Rab5bind/PF09311_11/5_5e02Rab5bind/PF09311_11/0_064HOOK/PF05622_12/2e03HOOK/PF05622_12/0_013DivIVA/PF05103_13/3_3e02DivIVA/PF05103_13/0_84Ax_dynein_light
MRLSIWVLFVVCLFLEPGSCVSLSKKKDGFLKAGKPQLTAPKKKKGVLKKLSSLKKRATKAVGKGGKAVKKKIGAAKKKVKASVKRNKKQGLRGTSVVGEPTPEPSIIAQEVGGTEKASTSKKTKKGLRKSLGRKLGLRRRKTKKGGSTTAESEASGTGGVTQGSEAGGATEAPVTASSSEDIQNTADLSKTDIATLQSENTELRRINEGLTKTLEEKNQELAKLRAAKDRENAKLKEGGSCIGGFSKQDLNRMSRATRNTVLDQATD